MSILWVRVTKTRVVEVDSLAAAGRAVRDAIEGELGWMGCREWTLTVAGHRDGTVVYEATQVAERLVQKAVAVVSYNGRVWGLDGNEIAACTRARA